MAIILNLNLPVLVSSINEILCLQDPGDGSSTSAFQVTQTTAISSISFVPPQNLVRNTSLTSAGFPFSTLANPVPLPANAYTFNLPSSAYGIDSSFNYFSVLQINTAIAKIEPGFSRLYVTYTYGVSSVAAVYFNVPFYEGWNVTDRELNNVVEYIEDGTSFLFAQLNGQLLKLNYFQAKSFWRGISVSGKITWTPATANLTQGMLR